MGKANIFYAQSGGVTPVINATACGVIETARQYKDNIGKVLAGRNGILGALHEELIDTSKESKSAIAALRHTPGGAFGSCRHKLKSLTENAAEYHRLIDVFKAHNIHYFFYNGGNDSQDTAYKVSQISKQLDYPLTCIGIPKTIDNDLVITDNCPGFASVAKYTAVSIMEAGLDVASMAASSTKVFVLEVMGRHAGWIAAAGGLAAQDESQAPHIILFPENTFAEKPFLNKVKQAVNQYGYCAIVVSEGLRDKSGQFLAQAKLADAFGHAQLGGVAPVISGLIHAQLGYKCHWAVSDYLQRSARHIASQVDVDQAYTLGKKAVEFALKGMNNIMLTIERKNTKKYSWKIGHANLSKVANKEKPMPRKFMSRDGYHISQACRNYLLPLIQGEAYPPYKNGLPVYQRLHNKLVDKKLANDFVLPQKIKKAVGKKVKEKA